MSFTISGRDYAESQGVFRSDSLAHIGTMNQSGRYRRGSGDQPYQHGGGGIEQLAKELKAQGLTEIERARAMGFESTAELRNSLTLARNERKQDEIHEARKLKASGDYSNVAIAKELTKKFGRRFTEPTVRNLLKDSQERKAQVIDNVTKTLREAVDKKGYIDVGAGVEYQLGITSTRLRSVLQNLKNEGYQVHSNIQLEQLGTGQKTNYRVLTGPDKTWGDVQKNKHLIEQINSYSDDGGLTVLGMLPPKAISSKRVDIRYAEDGGASADGVIFVRPGVKDVTLDKKRYAQVRINVDNTHYIKGMAIYKDDLPKGVDLQFNTNKSNTGNKLDALKPLKKKGDTDEVDWDNPFGASISRQIGEGVDPKTLKPAKLTSVMNIVNEEGKWGDWSKTLSSQMLSKQQPVLAKRQLDETYRRKQDELEDIMRLTNPSVKRRLLQAYADGADASAVHLKAVALPRQKTQVILPLQSLKDTEVYAPNFNDGETVVLVRFPHGGRFEIPQVKVNNKNAEGKKLLGDSRDAIGINPKVAERLSGADFDGDTVLVIPNNSGRVKNAAPLKALEGFDPKSAYPAYEGMPKMASHGPQSKGFQMGLISNLITDMTIRGANDEELARAVKHSMVVIDAEKHNLDWKRSSVDNGIPALIKRYQPESKSATGGASTLISKAKSRIDVDDLKPRAAKDGGPIDPRTGRKMYGEARTWKDKDGTVHVKQRQSVKLAETDDANTLSSGTVIERVYAEHSNRMKGLGNQARKAMLETRSIPYSPSARETYKKEVDELDSMLALALRNAPLERQAQVYANATVRLKKQQNPSLNGKDADSKAELKKIKSQALAAARIRTGAEKEKFEISEAQWKAIQAGAVTKNKLDQILNYADLDKVKEMAMPRDKVAMPPNKVARAKSMKGQGYTWAEIAEALGVSVSTVQNELGTTVEGGE